MTLAQLAAYAPGLDWAAYLADAKVDRRRKLIVGDNTAVKALAALYDKTPLETLKTWQRFKVADQASALSVQALRRQQVRVRQDADRREGAAAALAPRHRPGRRPPRRAARPDLCRALLPAAVQGDDGGAGRQPEEGGGRSASRATAGWSEATKQAALAKLDKMDVMVGYPEKFRDYSKLADEGRTTSTATSSAARPSNGIIS